MDAFIGEIKAFPYNFVPVNWLPCDGTLYPTSQRQYQALYSIIGQRYGGSGTQFAVPDLRGRVAVGVGSDFPQVAMKDGVESVALDSSQMSNHNHKVTAYIHLKQHVDLISNTPGADYFLTNGTTKIPSSGGNPLSIMLYSSVDPGSNAEVLNAASVGAAGGTPNGCAPHENRQPYLAFRYCICYADAYYPQPSI